MGNERTTQTTNNPTCDGLKDWRTDGAGNGNGNGNGTGTVQKLICLQYLPTCLLAYWSICFTSRASLQYYLYKVPGLLASWRAGFFGTRAYSSYRDPDFPSFFSFLLFFHFSLFSFPRSPASSLPLTITITMKWMILWYFYTRMLYCHKTSLDLGYPFLICITVT